MVPFGTRWVAERNSFRFHRNVTYTARTDGHLRNQKGQSFSLIEVKPRERVNHISIRMQETAQIAAWILDKKIRFYDPDNKCEYVPRFLPSSRIRVAFTLKLTWYRMFLLSQDKDELFLTFPYFGTDYGKPFKNIRDLREKNFLRMHEYRPFSLRSKQHVSYLARFLLDYTVHKSRQ